MEIIKALGIKREKDYRAVVKVRRTEVERGVTNSLQAHQHLLHGGREPAVLQFQELPNKEEMIFNDTRTHTPFTT